MKIKYILQPLLFLFPLPGLMAQNKTADSLSAAKVLGELITICRTVDFADPKVSELGIFYKAAPYIIYRGPDKIRAWKDFTNYSNESEKKGVDEVCQHINGTVNRDSSYRIIKYFTERESEGIWHLLQFSYNKKGIDKNIIFAFLKIDNRFGLGDID